MEEEIRVRIGTDLKRRVKAKCALEGRLISALVRELLSNWLKEGDNKPKQGVGKDSES